MVHVYIYDILFITERYFVDQLKALEKVLKKLVEVELKVNAEMSFFGCIETEYIRF